MEPILTINQDSITTYIINYDYLTNDISKKIINIIKEKGVPSISEFEYNNNMFKIKKHFYFRISSDGDFFECNKDGKIRRLFKYHLLDGKIVEID